MSDDELLSCLVYARGSGDDKGPLYGNLMALRTMRAVTGQPPCRLKFLFDGEEEIGSPHLPAFLRTHRQRFQGDVMIIADGPMHPSGRPTVSLDVRGVMMLEIRLQTANQMLHSGHYGKAAPNAAWELIQLLATMRDPAGNCLVPGFYADATPPTSEEQQLLAACRQIVEHVQARCPGADVEVIHGYEAYKIAVTHPQVQKVVGAVHDLCTSMGEAEPPIVLPTMGGSLPLHDLGQALGIPLISLPLANHDDNQHAPNANLRLGHFVQGISTMLTVLHGLASGHRT